MPDNPKLLTLPGVAKQTGVSVDRLRKAVKGTLAPAGLVTKIGSTWIAEAANAQIIADAAVKSAGRKPASEVGS